ncbi:MAG: rhodanese-like domain-containing protein [Bellilinea sp.]
MTLPPEISPQQLHQQLRENSNWLILDVREPYEWTRAFLHHPAVIAIPLSELAARGADALPEAARNPQQPLVILCHHGERSRAVAAWLLAQGWQQVFNLAGGIDAYARLVDRQVGIY